MEQKQITLERIYELMKNMQQELHEIREEFDKEEREISHWEGIKVLADERLLAESWLSKEDEEAFAYLQ